MAGAQNTKAVNLIAGEDLRGDVYQLLKIENDNGVGKVVKTTAATDTPVGILAEDPRTDATTDGENVPVVLISAGGVALVTAGGTITAGQLLVADSGTPGTVVGVADQASLAADVTAIGIAVESAVANDIFRFVAMPLTSSTET